MRNNRLEASMERIGVMNTFGSRYLTFVFTATLLIAGLIAIQKPLCAATLGTFTGTDSVNGLAASATFTLSGNELIVQLLNTSTSMVTQNPQVLSGLFFNVSGNPALSSPTVQLERASVYVNTSPNSPSGVLGDHWGYSQGSLGINHQTYEYGFGAAGFSGVFGSGNTISGNNQSMQGVDYGLVGPGGVGTNDGLANNGPQIQNGVDFTLTGLDSQNPPVISNVLFQYGSASSGEFSLTGTPQTSAVPEPGVAATLLAFCMALGYFGLRYLRRPVVCTN